MNDFSAFEQGPTEHINSYTNGIQSIMVVENDADTLLLISELIKGLGYEVIEATNGSDALEKLIIQKPSLIFMDIDMPVLNGYDATIAIRKMQEPFCNIPVIAVTAYISKDEQEKYIEAGINQVIAKPFRLVQIQARLEQFLPREIV